MMCYKTKTIHWDVLFFFARLLTNNKVLCKILQPQPVRDLGPPKERWLHDTLRERVLHPEALLEWDSDFYRRCQEEAAATGHLEPSWSLRSSWTWYLWIRGTPPFLHSLKEVFALYYFVITYKRKQKRLSNLPGIFCHHWILATFRLRTRQWRTIGTLWFCPLICKWYVNTFKCRSRLVGNSALHKCGRVSRGQDNGMRSEILRAP